MCTWSQVVFILSYDVFLSMKVVLISADSFDPDIMHHTITKSSPLKHRKMHWKMSSAKVVRCK